MKKVYRKLRINLTSDQRKALENIIRKGESNAMEIRRANILLHADESDGRKRYKDVVIADMFGITIQAVHDVKVKYLEAEIKRPSQKDNSDQNSADISVIKRKKRENPPVPAKIDGTIEAKITAIACSTPPKGHSRWTLRLIADKIVELQILDSVSHTQVGRVLKKTNSSLI